MDPLADLRSHSVNPSPEVDTCLHHKQTIYTVDDVFAHPDDVRESALSATYFDDTDSFFPGRRALLNFDPTELLQLIRRIGLPDKRKYSSQCCYSEVTKSESELELEQTQPHFDSIMPSDYSAVVYLNLQAQCSGGTGFYTHKETGLQRIFAPSEEASDDWFVRYNCKSYETFTRSVLFPQVPTRRTFPTDSDDRWKLDLVVPMKYNRMVLFPSNCFHSATLAASDFGTARDTRRLTLNVFAKRTDEPSA